MIFTTILERVSILMECENQSISLLNLPFPNPILPNNILSNNIPTSNFDSLGSFTFPHSLSLYKHRPKFSFNLMIETSCCLNPK